MNEQDEREWQRQEQARARASAAKSAASPSQVPRDTDDPTQSTVALALLTLHGAEVPPDFESVAASAILARTASDRRVRRRFERRVLGLLWLGYAIVLVSTALVLARGGLPILYSASWHDVGWVAIGAALCLTGVQWRRR